MRETLMLRRLSDRKLVAFVASGAILILLGCHDSPTQPIPDAVLVTPSASLVQVGDSVMLSTSYQFGATSQAADGRIRWTSSDTTAFTVDQAGYGHALKYSGTPITVTATASGVSGSTDIGVLPKFDSLIVTVSAAIAAGRTVRPSLAIVRADPSPYPSDSPFLELPELSAKVALSSSDPATLSVASDGSIHALAVGHATITGQLAGKSSTVQVDVVSGYAVKSLSGTADYTVKGVNDASAIIASRAGDASHRATDVLWHDGTATDLGLCVAHDLNNAGQVACEVMSASYMQPGVYSVGIPGIYSAGTVTELFDRTAYHSGASTGITESGTVFGLVRDAVGTPALFLSTSSGVTIPALAGYWYGDSYDINSLNHAVVVSRTAEYPSSSIIGASSSIALSPLSGRWAEARYLNDADDAVGWSEGWGGLSATIWRASNNWKPESPGYRADRPVGISEAGLVVGNGTDGPYVWHSGRYTILNDAIATSGWTLSSVGAISRSGIVAAQGTNADGTKSVILIDLGQLP